MEKEKEKEVEEEMEARVGDARSIIHKFDSLFPERKRNVIGNIDIETLKRRLEY